MAAAKHADAQRGKGRLAWPTPLDLRLGQLAQHLWNHHLQSVPNASLLLSSLQERAIWKRIVRNSTADADAVVRLASNAWKLLSDFNAHGQRWCPWRGTATSDAESFREWAEAFDRECQRKHWISRSDLPLLLVTPIQPETIALPSEILLIGFDRITPSQQSLINALRSAGVGAAVLETPGSERNSATD